MRVLVLMGAAFSSIGGVQRICQHIAKALTDAPLLEAEVRILCLNDNIDRIDSRYVKGSASFRGYNRRKLAFAHQAIQTMLAWRPDLVVATHTDLAPIPYLVGQVWQQLRYVVVAYGIDVWGRLPVLKRRGLLGANRVISISHYTARCMEASSGVHLSNVRILPLCLDPFWVSEASVATAKSDEVLPLAPRRVLLSVSRLETTERYKGHKEVIAALPKIRHAVSDVYYVAVGAGDLAPILKQCASEAGVADIVHFPGARQGSELCAYYSAADLFVMPSRKEGFGLVFLEAMFHEKAVVAGNQDATPEVVQHGKTGLLVNPADSAAIANAVIRLLKNDQLRQDMGRRGHELVVREYTFDKFKANLWAILEEVLGM